MLVQIALRETEKAIDEDNILDGKTGYVKWNSDELWWYDRKTNNARRVLTHAEIFASYDPYYEVKEIRPEKAGELWESSSDTMFFTYRDRKSGEIVFVHRDGSGEGVISNKCDGDIIHGEGWTRLYPKVEDDSVERAEWISAKDELPMEGRIVLWWNADIRMVEFGSSGSFNGENVTYWMPLPGSPKDQA